MHRSEHVTASRYCLRMDNAPDRAPTRPDDMCQFVTVPRAVDTTVPVAERGWANLHQAERLVEQADRARSATSVRRSDPFGRHQLSPRHSAVSPSTGEHPAVLLQQSSL